MALATITHIRGRGVYLPGDDIDTDRIIPARYLKCVTFDDLAEGLFRDERVAEDGSLKGHPLDDARFRGARILLSGANFGCGSSREHAPQAIYRAGFRAILAESFAEIFFGNAVTLGMPCALARKEDLEALAAVLEQAPETEIVLDIGALTVQAGALAFRVTMRDSAQRALTSGRWDPIAELLEASQATSSVAQRLGYLTGKA